MSKELVMNLENHMGQHVETEDLDRAIEIQDEFLPDLVELKNLLGQPLEKARQYKAAAFRHIEVYNRNASEISRFEEAAEIAALHSALSDFLDGSSGQR